MKFGLSYELIRFIHLNTSILLIYIFYKCLILKFSEIDKKILLTLSLVIFLSPTFRSLSIWPDSRIIGVIFFTLSIYEYLKFKKKKLGINIWKNIIYLIISSYISPNFSFFIIYFFYNYLKILNLRTIIYISLFSLIMSLPAFYFLFVLDINFLLASTPGTSGNELIGLSFNFSNKILIISSIFMFHISPFLINKEFIKIFSLILKNYINTNNNIYNLFTFF